jgi:hypothetical protein
MLINKSIVLFVTTAFTHVNAAIIRKRALAPQFSPTFPNLAEPSGVVTSYNPGPYDTETPLSTKILAGFPGPWSQPDTNSAEVTAAYNAIDWTIVPNAPIRGRNSDGSWVSNSDGPDDPYCWWSSTNCVTPKSPDLPPDLYTCPHQGDWGLNYDDGPFNRYTDSNADRENDYAEPALYNFLAEQGLHASLFVSTYQNDFSYTHAHYINNSTLAPMSFLILLQLDVALTMAIIFVCTPGLILHSPLKPIYRSLLNSTGH